MKRLIVLAVVSVLGLWSSGCRLWNDDKPPTAAAASSPTAPTPATPTNPTIPTVTSADLAACVARTNAVRSAAGRPFLAESSALEAYALANAKDDAASGKAHGKFTRENGGGVSFAENEILGTLNLGLTVQQAFTVAVNLFASEGPGGGHYENIIGPYTQVGCAAWFASGGLTVTQEFR